MKVAVLSPQPRTSGVVAYSHHLRTGFRDLGHEAHVLTFTLSGKPAKAFTVGPRDEKGVVRSGWGWTSLGFDRCEKWSDATEVLGEYDLIVMEEPRCAPMDKRFLRELGEGDIKAGRDRVEMLDVPDELLPPYISALAAQSKTKIAFTLHDPWYGRRHAPFLEYFLDSVLPDAVITHRDGALESAAWAMSHSVTEVRIEHLPYAPSGYSGPRVDQLVVGSSGRYINNKGQPTLILAAALGLLPSGWSVNIGGASPLGAGPNHTFLTYEGLLKHYNFEGVRESPDVTRGWPWKAWRDDVTIEYSGPYESPVGFVAKNLGIHINATDPAFSGPGSIEYSTLEAMDAGKLIVVPETALPKEGAPVAFPFEVEKLANAELSPVGQERYDTAMNLAQVIGKAAMVLETGQQQSAVKDNYLVLEQYHAPTRYAGRILEEVF